MRCRFCLKEIRRCNCEADGKECRFFREYKTGITCEANSAQVNGFTHRPLDPFEDLMHQATNLRPKEWS